LSTSVNQLPSLPPMRCLSIYGHSFTQFPNCYSKHYIHLYPVVCENTLSTVYILFLQYTDVKLMYQLIVYYHSFKSKCSYCSFFAIADKMR